MTKDLNTNNVNKIKKSLFETDFLGMKFPCCYKKYMFLNMKLKNHKSFFLYLYTHTNFKSKLHSIQIIKQIPLLYVSKYNNLGIITKDQLNSVDMQEKTTKSNYYSQNEQETFYIRVILIASNLATNLIIYIKYKCVYVIGQHMGSQNDFINNE